ncbi:unnamed protein product [Cyclocybe aegerita]|uniref:CCAAT-binding factor domain-containing protein n=1 Tax=Cyclocybe aegerita TaxID=1973307 RepID=A0A8S0XRC4_CYCAE|nr:unnamed protein product [Cyclocybe aegerita]
MVRLRREKGGATRPSQTQPGAVSKNDLKGKEVKGKRKEKDKGKGSISISKDAILALGGEEADMDLLKGVDESAVAVSGQENHDPMLSKDVSKFLKGLNLKDSHPQPQPKKNNGKGKEKVKALSEQPSTKEKSTSISEPDKSTKPSKKTQKERSKTKAKTSSATNAASVPAPPDQPKTTVKLPAKVPINPKSHFVFTPTSQWYAALPALPPQAPPPPLPTPAQFASLSSKAAQLHAADTDTFLTSSAASSASASEASFMAKIIQSGTLSSRLSALTLLVQSSPVHNTKALEGLRGLGERGKGKGGREESLKALRCVVDWWVGGGVPGRKLRYFRDQPLLHPGVTDEYLVVWYFEDWLKKYFFSILQILETLSLDPLPYVRTQSLTLISTLLRDSPEQEHNLLRLLVNKLGDTDKALCARASWHLLQLLQRHPEMKGVVVREVVGMVMRPGAGMSAPAEASAASTAGAAGGKHIRFSEAEKLKTKPQTKPKEKRPSNAHARYYAAVTFNQIVLSPGDRDVALRLLDVYFEMFKEVLGEGSESDVQEEGAPAAAEEVKTDKNGRVLDESKAKGKGRKGEKGGGEKKGAAGFTEVEDENSRLVSAILTGVNRALPFAKVDTEDAGINKHIDTLFLITHKSTFNISLQALMLIQQITASLLSSSSPPPLPPPPPPPQIPSSTGTTARSTPLYTTRASRPPQNRRCNERVRALVRRFVQVLVSGGGGATEFVAGGLYLLGELFSTIPGLRQMVTRPLTEMKEGGEEYDPRKREPQFAHAGSSPLWELTSLLNHYHPAISLHARQLLS